MKSWAIIVGINDYHADAGQRPLHGAVGDAADFADWALHRDGGGVAPERLFFWTHPRPAHPSEALNDYLQTPTHWWDLLDAVNTPDFGRAPYVNNITETALRAGRAAAADAMGTGDGEERRCYVFFAGHGLQTSTTGATTEVQTCFVAGDFRPDSATVMGLLPCEDLRRALLSGGFDQVFMFLDCCRVAVTKFNQAAPTIGAPNTRMPPQPLWGVGNAAQRNMIAFETTAQPIRGAFTKTLLQGLRTVRDPETSELTLDSLRVFVRDNIKDHTANEQRPHFVGDPTDPAPIVVRGPPLPQPQVFAPVRVNFTDLPAGTVVRLSDSAGAPVGDPLIAGPAPVEVQALTGRYYSLDVVEPLRSVGFHHPGPEVKLVEI